MSITSNPMTQVILQKDHDCYYQTIIRKDCYPILRLYKELHIAIIWIEEQQLSQ